MSKEKTFNSIDEVSERTGWHRATIFEWIKRLGIEKHHFVGSRATFITEEDTRWLEDIKKDPTQSKQVEPRYISTRRRKKEMPAT